MHRLALSSGTFGFWCSSSLRPAPVALLGTDRKRASEACSRKITDLEAHRGESGMSPRPPRCSQGVDRLGQFAHRILVLRSPRAEGTAEKEREQSEREKRERPDKQDTQTWSPRARRSHRRGSSQPGTRTRTAHSTEPPGQDHTNATLSKLVELTWPVPSDIPTPCYPIMSLASCNYTPQPSS
ncbi:hypothetical protein BX600DRAFT_435410 [Xylariales sp. PMI_506]|nr:hypothetical protein BX600DRAFT_435410 [Xylariales sp. PMI_506]